MTVFVILAIVVIALLWAVTTANGFKEKEIKIQESLSGIEVALTKRYDLLTKLLDTAKGYMSHERRGGLEAWRVQRGL